MKIALKKAWLEGLRSKEFEQGEDSLCSIGEDEKPRYCCLGVLCEVMIKNPELAPNVRVRFGTEEQGITQWVRPYFFTFPKPNGEAEAESSTVCFPVPAGKELGLEQVVPALKGTMPPGRNVLQIELMNRNDEGQSFAEIADYIEKTVLEEP